MLGLIAKLASEIHICIDNLNIRKEAGSVPNGSSQIAFIKFREGVKSWRQKRKKNVSPISSKPHRKCKEQKSQLKGKKISSSIIHAHKKGSTNPGSHPQSYL